MESSQVTSNTSNTLEVPKQESSSRVKKLKGVDLAPFPGVTLPPEKEVEPDYSYSLVVKVPATSTLGAPAEAIQVHDFAHQFDLQAKAKGVGAVTSVSVVDGLFDVVLKLNAIGKQANHGAPAANAFNLLKDFFGNAELLKNGPAGKSALYMVMVNGKDIVEGHF